MGKKQLTYEQAIKELEEIVRLLESNSLGLDEIAGQVDRAQQLIVYCREKLTKTDADIQKLFK